VKFHIMLLLKFCDLIVKKKKNSVISLNFEVETSLGGAINTYLIQNNMFTFKVGVFIPPPLLLVQ
jgi:hypothetical protein